MVTPFLFATAKA